MSRFLYIYIYICIMYIQYFCGRYITLDPPTLPPQSLTLSSNPTSSHVFHTHEISPHLLSAYSSFFGFSRTRNCLISLCYSIFFFFSRIQNCWLVLGKEFWTHYSFYDYIIHVGILLKNSFKIMRRIVLFRKKGLDLKVSDRDLLEVWPSTCLGAVMYS